MGEVAELVARFASQFQLDTDPEARLLTLDEFCATVRRLDDVEAEVAEGLQGLLGDRDPIRVILWVQAAITRPSTALVGPLCELLSVRDRYVQHEWIAELLGEIGDPRAIPALSRTCTVDFDDAPFYALPKKCLQALAVIRTSQAKVAIEAQSTSSWMEVRDEVATILAHWDDTSA